MSFLTTGKGTSLVKSIIASLFGGPVNGSTATSGQVLTKQSDGSWAGAAGGGGSITVEDNTDGVGSPNILTSGETGKYLTNTGSSAKNYHTLPTAAAGLIFTFLCLDSDGIRIVANSGDTIRLDLGVTSAAGYVESTSLGSTITLLAADATQWVAVQYIGDWTVSA